MNRRIVLVDQEETPNYASYIGCGLGNEIYTVQHLESLGESKRREILDLKDGDGALLVGASPFKYFKQYYHLGIRGEDYFECSRLLKISADGGAFVKVICDFPGRDVINYFMSPDFTTKLEMPWFKQKIIHTYSEAMDFLNWIDSLPTTEDLGFDYETSGKSPLEKVFFVSGLSLCTYECGGFISITDILRTCSDEEMKNLIKRLGDILEARMNHLWAFNMQFEYQVSHRWLDRDLYDLCDASVVNVLDGFHLRKYSLKWTAQRVLTGIQAWDTDFDRLSDLMDSMFYETVGKTKKTQVKVLKVTKDNYKNTPEWDTICKKYPNHVAEFERLIHDYWGYPFMCVPSDILGYYCNLDAFYTLMIYKSREKEYTKEAFDVFLDNTRLGARLHSSGLYIDEPYRLKYKEESEKMMAWGITYCATARCWIKMKKHSVGMANIKKYNPHCVALLKRGEFFNGSAPDIVKALLKNNLDTMDYYRSGLNEGSLALKYGQNTAEELLRIVEEAATEVKLVGKIDENTLRKRKFLGVLADKLAILLDLEHVKIDKKHIELEKYIHYESAYKELSKVSGNQLMDINNIPSTIRAFGSSWTPKEFAMFIAENYFKCTSPEENDEIIDDMFQLYKGETCFIAALGESIQQLPGDKKNEFFKNLGITDMEGAYNHFYSEWRRYTPGIVKVKERNRIVYRNEDPNFKSIYPMKIFDLSLVFGIEGINYETAKDVKPVKDTWADFYGFNTQATFFGEYKNQIKEYCEPFQEEDITDDRFFFMRKFSLNYLLFKKYAKVLSTYIEGMFKANNKWVIENENHIPIRYAEPGEEGAVEKCFVKYEVNTKSSKRWASGFHTIISHSDLKDCIRTPYRHAKFDGDCGKKKGEVINEPFLETYFDINK